MTILAPFRSIKAGDRVRVVSDTGAFSFEVVKRITPTQIITEDGYRYSRDHGNAVWTKRRPLSGNCGFRIDRVEIVK